MTVMEYIETNVAKELSGDGNILTNTEKADTYYNTINSSLKRGKVVDYDTSKNNVTELTKDGLSKLKNDMKNRERPTIQEENEEEINQAPNDVPVFDPNMYNNVSSGNFVINENGEIER